MTHELSIDGLKSRTRRAYELGRLRLGIGPALGALSMIVFSIMIGRDPAFSFGLGSLLLTLAVGFAVRGGLLGRAVGPGLLAGMAPLVLPAALRFSGHCCAGGACYSLCLFGCIGGGVFGGFVLGSAAASGPDRYRFLAAASLLTGSAGLLGCMVAGAAGMIGMAIAVALASLPIVVLAPRASAS